MMKSRTISGWLLALTLTVPACAEEPAEEPVEDLPVVSEPLDETGEMATDGITVADIAGDPAEYIGRTVTVEGDLQEVLGPMAFTLDEDALTEAGIDNDLLVIGAQSGNLAEIDDQWVDNRVRVSGTVGMWTIVEIEREVGWDLDSELETEIEGREAVLIATSVERVQ